MRDASLDLRISSGLGSDKSQSGRDGALLADRNAVSCGNDRENTC